MSKLKLTKVLSPKQFEWRNHPHIYAWTRQNGLISPSDHERWLEKIKNDPSIMMFGIEISFWEAGQTLQGTPAPVQKTVNIGTCGLTSISYVHGSAEFSLFIAPEFQGQCWGSYALQELLRYGFNHLRLNCIWGETFVANRALKIFRELGFKEEGTLRQRYYKDGSYVDSIAVSILLSEAKEQSWWTNSLPSHSSSSPSSSVLLSED